MSPLASALRTSASDNAADYNLLRGVMPPIGKLVLTAAPLIAAKVRHVL